MGTWAGIDAGKRWLDVHVGGSGGAHFRVANDAEGHARPVARLGDAAVAGVAVEASGGYEREAHAAMSRAGLRVAAVNPARVRHFAEGTGRLAETDRVDAAVLAAFGAYLEPAPAPAREGARAALAELLTYRRQLNAELAARAGQLRGYAGGPSRARAEEALDRLRRERREPDGPIRAAVAKEPPLEALLALPTGAPAVGPVLAAALIADLPEPGALDRRRIASLAGLAPFPRDSGERRGCRAVRDGRAEVRQVLYMAALVALRRHAPLGGYIGRLRARGEPAEVALVAAMREPLTVPNAVARSGRPWKRPPEPA
jgi:transposase